MGDKIALLKRHARHSLVRKQEHLNAESADGKVVYRCEKAEGELLVRKVALANDLYAVQWVVDSDVPECMLCRASFSFLRWRHHCRGCGKIVCTDCFAHSKIRVASLQATERKSIACYKCYDSLRTNPQLSTVANLAVTAKAALSESVPAFVSAPAPAPIPAPAPSFAPAPIPAKAKGHTVAPPTKPTLGSSGSTSSNSNSNSNSHSRSSSSSLPSVPPSTAQKGASATQAAMLRSVGADGNNSSAATNWSSVARTPEMRSAILSGAAHSNNNNNNNNSSALAHNPIVWDVSDDGASTPGSTVEHISPQPPGSTVAPCYWENSTQDTPEPSTPARSEKYFYTPASVSSVQSHSHTHSTPLTTPGVPMTAASLGLHQQNFSFRQSSRAIALAASTGVWVADSDSDESSVAGTPNARGAAHTVAGAGAGVGAGTKEKRVVDARAARGSKLQFVDENRNNRLEGGEKDRLT